MLYHFQIQKYFCLVDLIIHTESPLADSLLYIVKSIENITTNLNLSLKYWYCHLFEGVRVTVSIHIAKLLFDIDHDMVVRVKYGAFIKEKQLQMLNKIKGGGLILEISLRIPQQHFSVFISEAMSAIQTSVI